MEPVSIRLKRVSIWDFNVKPKNLSFTFLRFNEYFSSIASNIKSQISARQTFDPGGFDKFLSKPAVNTIYLRPVTASEVHETVKKLQKQSYT